MKKLAFMLLLIMAMLQSASAETYFLQLRSSVNDGYIRIVLEGPDSIISKAIVNQKLHNILVTFPGFNFIIKAGKSDVQYRKLNSDTVVFLPGSFRGLKVFTLQGPNRLVLDVYQDAAAALVAPKPHSGPERQDSTESVDSYGIQKDQQPAAPDLSSFSGIFVIDPGHGGYEYGIADNDYIEKHVSLAIAKKLNALIINGKSESYLTRSSDTLVTHGERVAFANSRKPDIFISLHVGTGNEIVIYAPAVTESVPGIVKPHLRNPGQVAYIQSSLALLNSMRKTMIQEFGDDMVAVKSLPYSMLERINAAAIMLEFPSFKDAIYEDALTSELAEALYRGIEMYEKNNTKENRN
ncbi:N-acetylmuramoyl-L-alanine amidase [bacterium]|nr:N-acetylmuramoyl-L-alanine amidase [bacterium]